MVINVSVQHNGGFVPDICTVDLIMLLPSGNPFKCHEEVNLYLQAMILPKRFDVFPPDWGMLRRSRCVQILLNYIEDVTNCTTSRCKKATTLYI